MSLDTTAPITIDSAGAADVPVLAGVLARAFQDDPVFAWSIPDEGRRLARLPAVFAAFADVYLPYDETYVAGDGAAAALWAPAGVDPFDGRAGDVFAGRLAELLGDDAARCLEVGAIFQEHHPPQPWTYLQLIGVVPERQGVGLGSALLAPVLERCDATGTPAYLEASTAGNRRLYERHGFEVVGELALPDDGPTVWPMWREPATAAGPRPR
jgi:GNAT superfamily N-acetyltransferase